MPCPYVRQIQIFGSKFFATRCIPEKLLPILDNMEYDIVNSDTAKLIRALDIENETKEIIKNTEKIIEERLYSDKVMLDVMFDHNLLLETCRDDSPTVTIIPAGSSHVLNLYKALVDKLGYSPYYFNSYPPEFILSNDELNELSENFFKENFIRAARVAHSIIN